MHWLLWRELTVMTRTRAVWVAICLQLLVLTAFILVWGDGVPLMTGNVFEQFSTVHAVLLLVVLPWVAARVAGDERTVSLIAAIAACAPRHVVVARYLALVLVLLAVAVSALPLKILALRISAVDPWRGVFDLLPILALCALSAAIATGCVVAGASRFTAWLLGTGTTLFGAALISPPQAPAVMLAALVMTVLSAMRADQRLEYLAIGGTR